MRMRIGVLYNCQHRNIANALRCLVPGSEVVHFEIVTLRTPQAHEQAAAVLQGCDVLFVLPDGPRPGPLTTEALRPRVRRLVILPPISFTGFHPDTVYVTLPDRSQAIGPTDAYHSRIVVAAYLGFLDRYETVALFNTLTYQKLGYFEEYNRAAAFLAKQFGAIGVDIAPHFERWRARGCFMHSINHPKPYVTNSLAAIACQLAGIPIESDDPAYLDMVPDGLAEHPRLPVYPEIAERLGVRGHLHFKPSHNLHQNNFRLLPLDEFVAESLALYKGVPRQSLLAAEGVADALRALGLHEVAGA